MKITLRVFGREVVNLGLDREHTPAAQPEPAEPPPPQPSPDREPMGFWGGAGGSQEHNWQPDVHRPLEADR